MSDTQTTTITAVKTKQATRTGVFDTRTVPNSGGIPDDGRSSCGTRRRRPRSSSPPDMWPGYAAIRQANMPIGSYGVGLDTCEGDGVKRAGKYVSDSPRCRFTEFRELVD